MDEKIVNDNLIVESVANADQVSNSVSPLNDESLDNHVSDNNEFADTEAVDSVETVSQDTVLSFQNGEDDTVKPASLKEKLESIKANMPNWMKKTCNFISREWLYFSVPLLIFALFMGVLYSMNIYPFGTDIMSNYDLLAQIAPFYEHFYDVIDGKSSLFYSPAIAGGADVFGTLAYCAVSPFTFIFLFFGRTTVYNAISFVLPLKLSCVACAAIYFLKKEFKNIPEYIVLVMSLLYAYCGYMFVANTYVNWVDFLIYMPFVVIGFKKLVTEKKILYFGISYALMIYACFSIACFALFLVFIIFVAYIILACDKADRKEVFAKMCLSLVVSVGLAMPLLVPALFAYMRSGRNTGLFENMDNALSPNHLYSKFTYILSDTAFLFFTIVYFVKNRFKTKLDRFLFATALILMMPVLVDEVCNLMNFGSYMSYSLRFGFLNSTFAFYMAARLLDSIEIRSVNKWLNITFTAVIVVCAALVIYFIINMNNAIMAPDSPDGEFSSRLAFSTGGLEIIYQLALVISALLALAVILYSCRLVSFKFMSYAIIGVVVVQIAFYNIHLVRGNSFNPLRYDQYNAIFDTIDQYEDRRYYRVKDNSAAITSDAAFNTHTNSFAVFSSVIDRDNFMLTEYFKYDGNHINSVETRGGTFFSDSLLGYKYFYVHTDVDGAGEKHSTKRRPYLVKLEETQQENFCAYENIGVFPNCYTVDTGKLEMNDPDFCTNMNELYNFLGGEGSLFLDVKFTEGYHNLHKLEVLTDSNTGEVIYSFQINTTYDGHYYIDTDFPDEYNIGYSSSTSSDKFNLNYEYLHDTLDYNYNASATGAYHLCIKSLDEKELDLQTVIDSVTLRVITNEKVIELSEYLDTRACEYVQERNTFTIKAHADNDETYVLLNYVAIEGFEATVNGKKAEVIDNGIKFLLVKLDEGDNTVVLKYKSPYYKYIAIGVVIGAILVAICWLMLSKFKKVGEMLYPMICVIGIVVAVAIFAFFYAYPTSLFMKKLFALLFA